MSMHDVSADAGRVQSGSGDTAQEPGCRNSCPEVPIASHPVCLLYIVLEAVFLYFSGPNSICLVNEDPGVTFQLVLDPDLDIL